ncbi:MAG: hypothetical protein IJW67_13550 [Blautia sp.]|nr:hypothetical protein [Blautia sp.]
MSEKKHSGFDAPTYGELLPKGTKIIHNPNGTISHVFPDKAETKTANKSKKKPTKK